MVEEEENESRVELRASAWIYLSATLRESRSEGWRAERIMDGIPVMSRAACRNHAVHTLGCVNQTRYGRTYGKGGQNGKERTSDGQLRDEHGSTRHYVYLYGRNHRRGTVWLSHIAYCTEYPESYDSSIDILIYDRYSNQILIFPFFFFLFRWIMDRS